jgi:hypothetical protein
MPQLGRRFARDLSAIDDLHHGILTRLRTLRFAKASPRDSHAIRDGPQQYADAVIQAANRILDEH